MPLWQDHPDAWHEALPGVRRRILAHGEELTVALYRIDPGRVFPLHSHPQVQAGVFLEGGGEFQVGDQMWPMRVGSSYLIPGNVPHELRTDPRLPSVILDVFHPVRSDFAPELRAPDSG